tara:strand:- start:193 stop:420 length:228 start_codon:yes stop_codon:yes gene_type:complete
MKYIVENYIGNDWEIAFFLEDEKGRNPLTFETIEDAQKEINECIESCRDAIKQGYMIGPIEGKEYYRVKEYNATR